jgi:mono/diheme cytochrome c family protein
LRAFLIGLIIGLIAVPAAVYYYFASGTAPVATSAHPMPFEKMMANAALHARIDKEMPKAVPIAANEQNYFAGAQIYREQCAVCHGMPTGDQTPIAKGMFPKPPKLLQGKGVTDDEPGETYWKVAHGIRMTGMPSFRNDLTDTQMWQVSLLLANADKVPESVKQALIAPGQAPPAVSRQAPAPSSK